LGKKSINNDGGRALTATFLKRNRRNNDWFVNPETLKKSLAWEESREKVGNRGVKGKGDDVSKVQKRKFRTERDLRG